MKYIPGMTDIKIINILRDFEVILERLIDANNGNKKNKGDMNLVHLTYNCPKYKK